MEPLLGKQENGVNANRENGLFDTVQPFQDKKGVVKVHEAKFLLSYNDGKPLFKIAREMIMNPQTLGLG